MAIRHYTGGAIGISPPVTPAEIDEHGQVTGEDCQVALVVADAGVLAGHGTAVELYSVDGEFDGEWYGGDDDLARAVQMVVDTFRVTNDGTVRTFTGWLDCVAYTDEGESPYRVAVVDGKVEIFDPSVVWPPIVSGKPAGVSDIDVDGLPLTQYLLLEVLAARARLGEHCWTFPSTAGPALRKLAALGLVGWKAGPCPRTVLAWLTDMGRAACLSATYRTPTPTVSIAAADTRHFDFMAVDSTEQGARDALMAAWRDHARITGADPNYLLAEDVAVVTGPLGQAWRDGSPWPRTDKEN